jgi:hypothetical protein
LRNRAEVLLKKLNGRLETASADRAARLVKRINEIKNYLNGEGLNQIPAPLERYFNTCIETYKNQEFNKGLNKKLGLIKGRYYKTSQEELYRSVSNSTAHTNEQKNEMAKMIRERTPHKKLESNYSGDQYDDRREYDRYKKVILANPILKEVIDKLAEDENKPEVGLSGDCGASEEPFGYNG